MFDVMLKYVPTRLMYQVIPTMFVNTIDAYLDGLLDEQDIKDLIGYTKVAEKGLVSLEYAIEIMHCIANEQPYDKKKMLALRNWAVGNPTKQAVDS